MISKILYCYLNRINVVFRHFIRKREVCIKLARWSQVQKTEFEVGVMETSRPPHGPWQVQALQGRWLTCLFKIFTNSWNHKAEFRFLAIKPCDVPDGERLSPSVWLAIFKQDNPSATGFADLYLCRQYSQCTNHIM